MNPLTLVKRIQKINSQEATLGISEDASWHVKYKDSAYVFVGGIPYDLTEGDLLAVFAQYGEIVDVNLVRDKGTGKSKGFAFIAYEDQRSTILAILGRIIRVDHVTKYKKKEEEDEETEQKKREARGVCRAFQVGECTRGAGCKFSHDEQRAANTGWGAREDESSKWGHDNFDDPKDRNKELHAKGRKNGDDSERHPREIMRQENKSKGWDNSKESELKLKEDHGRKDDKRLKRHNVDDDCDLKSGDDHYKREEKKSKRNHDDELPKRYHNRREEDRSGRHGDEEYRRNLREEDRPRRHGDEEHRPNLREEDRPRRHGDEEYRPKLREDDDRRERRHCLAYRRGNQDEKRDFRSSRGRDSSSYSHTERNEDRHRERNDDRRR